MKEYNPILGALFSGKGGEGGYNAGFRQSRLAALYQSDDPEKQALAAKQLAAVDPEAAGKWQEETVKKSAQLLLALGKDNPVAQQAWQTRIKPNLSRIYGAQAASLPDLPDDSVMAVAQQIVGGSSKGKYTGAPVIVQTEKGPMYARYGENGMELTQFAPADSYTPVIDPVTGEVKGYSKQKNSLDPTTAGGGKPSTGPSKETLDSVDKVNDAGNRMLAAGATPQQVTAWKEQQIAALDFNVGMGNYDQATAPEKAPQVARVNVKPAAPKEATWNNPVIETRGGKQVRVRYNNQGGEQVLGEAEVTPPPKKAWTPAGLEKYNSIRTDVQVAQTLNTMMDDMAGLFNDPSFDLGPIQNKVYEAQNWSGKSTPQSQAYAKLKANFEKMRNDSLRLNKGVQTDGDAQRAWNEIMANMNDKELVKARLEDIKRYNEFALTEKRLQAENFESQFGAPGQSVGAGSAKGSQDNPVPITTKQQRDKLESGTWYIGPDGKKARKQ